MINKSYKNVINAGPEKLSSETTSADATEKVSGLTSHRHNKLTNNILGLGSLRSLVSSELALSKLWLLSARCNDPADGAVDS